MAAPVLVRAQADLDAGRLWKARDRLSGALRTAPHDEAILEFLGETYWRMGDHPAAARYWILTGRSSPEAETARLAFEERTGRSLRAQLSELPARHPLAAYPDAAEGQLALYAAAAEIEGWTWPRERPEPLTVDPFAPFAAGARLLGRLIGGLRPSERSTDGWTSECGGNPRHATDRSAPPLTLSVGMWSCQPPHSDARPREPPDSDVRRPRARRRRPTP